MRWCLAASLALSACAPAASVPQATAARPVMTAISTPTLPSTTTSLPQLISSVTPAVAHPTHTAMPAVTFTPGPPTATGVPIVSGSPFIVELTNFAFTPARLAARVGDTIQLELCNLDIAAPHLFEISALRISEVVAAGSARAVEFVVEKEGTYTSLCPLDTAGVNHAEAGMIGELIVEAAP